MLFFGLIILLVVAGCNTSSSGLKSAKDDKKATKEQAGETLPGSANAEPEEVATVINRPGKARNKGVYIKILVNNDPITNFDIKRRVEFLKLRRVGGNRNKVAENELIEQSLKLAEAKRRNTLISDAQVDTAYASFAKRNGATPSQLSQELGRLGIGSSHFKGFLRSQSSWQQTVNRKFQADTQRVSQVDAITQIRKSGQEKPELAEYNFQQVIFVVPEGKRSTTLAARRNEAKAFKQRFSSCSETLQYAKQLRDVSVVEQRRVMAPEVPSAWRNDVAKLKQGETTPVRDTNRGVEFIAICDLRMVNDDRAAQIATQSKEFESFNEKGGRLSQEYLHELRSNATIVYR